jgi:hypothetical protein
LEEDANDAKTTPNAEQLAPKKKKKKSDGGSGKVKTELHDKNSRHSIRGNGSRGERGRSSREKNAPRRRSDEDSKSKRGSSSKCTEGKGGKFTKAQQRKIRAVIKFGKGVQAETVESKFAWIARDEAIRVPVTQNDVVLSRTLGQGITGTVRLAKLPMGKYCACKCVQKNRVARAKDAVRVHTERKALTECKSPFVVQLLGTYQVPHSHEPSPHQSANPFLCMFVGP